MFAILQSLNNKQFYNYLNIAKKKTNKETLNLEKNKIPHENKISHENKIPNEKKLYIKDSFKLMKNTISPEESELNLYRFNKNSDDLKIENSLSEKPSNVFLYLVNSIFFFGLGIFANGRWKRYSS
jgi:hypothetical protein